MNIKFPCYLNAINTVNATPGTEEADVIGMMAVTVSGMVTMVIITIGIILLVPLKPLLQNENITIATSYILPALYGSIGISAFINKKVGAYNANKKPLVAIINLVLVFGFIFFVSDIAGKEGYAMFVMLIVSIIVANILYKLNILKLKK